MTIFSKFDFKSHSLDNKSVVHNNDADKDFFYRRMKKSDGKNNGMVFDLYVPKTRTLHKSMVFKNLGQAKQCVVLDLDEKKTIKNGFTPPNKIEDGAVFLEAELISQPCSIKDKKFVIYEEDLKNLADISNQPLLDSKWTTAGKTGVSCPYCHGYYYLDPAHPSLCLCPYCAMTKAEAQVEIDRINTGYDTGDDFVDEPWR